jgi:hypothetical protein
VADLVKDVLQEEDANFNTDSNNDIASMMATITAMMQAKQNINDKDEVTQVQPAVREMVETVLSGLPHAKQRDWYLKGTTSERSTWKERSYSDECCRVYNPLRGTPDIEMKAAIEPTLWNQFKTVLGKIPHNPSEQYLSDLMAQCNGFAFDQCSTGTISIDDCADKDRLSPAKPPVKVKRGSVMRRLVKSFKMSPDATAVRQAALYGICFILRVFPMLPDKVLDEVFGPSRMVYVPLMSICEMVLTEIDIASIVRSGMIRVRITQVLTGEEYARLLCRWVSWSSRISLALSKFIPFLRLRRPINSWVSEREYKKVWSQMPDGFTPKPSFYNPMWYNQRTGQYVRVIQSYWCGNFGGIRVKELIGFTGLVYMKEWKCANGILVMPDYGQPLSRATFQNEGDFRRILLGIVSMLKILVDCEYVHGDIRPPNIIVGTSGVRLIDFDLARFIDDDDLGNSPITDSSPPEQSVTSKYDVWGLGITLVRLCCTKSTQDSLKDVYIQLQQGENQYLETFHNSIEFDYPTLPFFEPEAVRKLIKGCVNFEEKRWSLVDLHHEISKWPQ